MNLFAVLINIVAFLAIAVPLLGFWTFVCYKKIKKWKDYEKRCTLKVCAEVTKVILKEPRELHMRGTGPLYKPIFKVCVMDRDIIIDSACFTNLKRFETGQEYWLYVNPANFQDFIYDAPYGTVIKRLDIGICVLVWVGMAAALIIMVAGGRS